MKTSVLLPLSFALVVSGAQAQSTGTPAPASTQEQTKPATPEQLLAAQVAAIVASEATDAEKQKNIGLIVRTAVTTATVGLKDTRQSLTVALSLAEAAAKAAPVFATTISTAVLSIPAIAALENAATQINAAVAAGVKAGTVPVVNFDALTETPAAPQPEFRGYTSDAVVSRSN